MLQGLMWVNMHRCSQCANADKAKKFTALAGAEWAAASLAWAPLLSPSDADATCLDGGGACWFVLSAVRLGRKPAFAFALRHHCVLLPQAYACRVAYGRAAPAVYPMPNDDAHFLAVLLKLPLAFQAA